MSFLKNSFAARSAFLIAGDLILAIVSVYLGVYSRFYNIYAQPFQEYSPVLFKAIFFAVDIIFMSFLIDLYGVKKGNELKEIVIKIFLAGFFALITLAPLYYFIPSLQLGRGILFYALFIFILLQSFWHIGICYLRRMPSVVDRVLILGTGPMAENMGKMLSSGNNGFALSGYVNCMGEPVSVPDTSVVGNGDGLLAVALKQKVNKIVVSLSERRGTFPVREVLDCKMQGIDVIDGPSFYEQLTGKLLIENINPSHLIFSEGFRITIFRAYLKRIFDVVISIVGLLVSLPFLVLVPIIIKLDSKGPILFRQKRVGEGEKIFTLYKFRTMVVDAEKDTGPVWSTEDDSRITRLGRFLRKSRLDEIPQLVNVLRGDMSFIGPRPERPFFVKSLTKQIPHYSERHFIKPGVTGWAQVRYEYGDSIDDALEKLKYDLYYMKYQSLTLDILIILKTIKVILFGRGGR